MKDVKSEGLKIAGLSILLASISLSNFAHASEANKKSKSKSHVVKKVDISPNDNDNDVWTYGLESNVYATGSYISPSIDFSASNGWDIQIASYNIPINAENQNSDADTYINIVKTFTLNPHFSALIGAQNGTNIASNVRQWHNFDYGLISYRLIPSIELHSGLYWVNKALSGTTNVLNFTSGFSIDLLDNRLTFEGNYFGGNSGVSGATVTLLYQVLPKIRIYMGVGVPEKDSGNEFYGIMGVSIASKSN